MKLSLKIVVNWKYFPQPTSVNYVLYQAEDIIELFATKCYTMGYELKYTFKLSSYKLLGMQN